MRGSTTKEAIWMTLEQVFSLGLAFLVGITVVRHLGPEATGALNYASTIGMLLGPLATLGLESIVIRELANGPNSSGGIWNNARKLLWWITLVNAVILGLVALTQPAQSLQQIALWATLLSGFSNLGTIYSWTFRAASRYREIAKLRLIQMVAIQVVRLALVYFDAPFIAFATILAVDPLIMAITMERMAKNRLAPYLDKTQPSFEIAKKLLQESWPLIMAGFAVTLFTRIDIVMLERLAGIKDVGVYSAATKISELWNIIPTTLMRAAFPKLAALAKTDPKKYSTIHHRFLILFLGLSLTLAIATQFSADWIIYTLYGTDFASSASPLKIHIWSSIPLFCMFLFGTSYQMFGVNKPLMWGCLVGSISNIVLNIFWIPTYGPTGASAATLVSYFLSLATPLICSRKCRSIALGFSLWDEKQTK